MQALKRAALRSAMLRVAALVVCSTLIAAPAIAAPHTQATISRQAAMQLAASVDTGTRVEQLMQHTVSGSTPEALKLLEQTSRQPGWPGAARDLAVHRYAERLRELPASAVSPELLSWLEAYTPLTWVQHEDHAGGSTPLLNTRATIAGVQNDWRREESTLAGLALVNAGPRALADSWVMETHPAVRAGYLQALEQARPAQRQALTRHATERAAQNPALAILAGWAALLDGDLASLEVLLLMPGHADTARLLREAAPLMSAEATSALLMALAEHGPASTAALAIAELYDQAGPEAREWMLQRLADPVLGASAALALARDRTPGLAERLQALSQSRDALLAARARLALQGHLPAAEPEP